MASIRDFVKAIGIAFLVVGLIGLTLSLIFPNGQLITTISSIAMIVLGIVFYVILGTLMDAIDRSARKDKLAIQK